MEAVKRNIRKNDRIFIQQMSAKIYVLLFLITGLLYSETTKAQNQTFPNSNQPPKAPSLHEYNQQQQIQIQQQNRQQMEKFGYQSQPSQQQMTVDFYDQQALSRQQKEKELYKIINEANNETRSNSKVAEEFNSLFLIADTN